MPRKTVQALVFDDFELLDVFGLLSLFGMLEDSFQCQLVSLKGGQKSSSAGPVVHTVPFSLPASSAGILLIPGGRGTRELANDSSFLETLAAASDAAQRVFTVCTGSALLAATGQLDGRKATSNKLAWDWATSNGAAVKWQRKARWVFDGKFLSSSGVSAGMDATLALIADEIDEECARKVAQWAEYRWQERAELDEFA